MRKKFLRVGMTLVLAVSMLAQTVLAVEPKEKLSEPKEKPYKLEVDAIGEGKVEVNKETYGANETITVKPKPAKGWHVENVRFLMENGEGFYPIDIEDGYEMPSTTYNKDGSAEDIGNVKVLVDFVEGEGKLPKMTDYYLGSEDEVQDMASLLGRATPPAKISVTVTDGRGYYGDTMSFKCTYNGKTYTGKCMSSGDPAPVNGTYTFYYSRTENGKWVYRLNAFQTYSKNDISSIDRPHLIYGGPPYKTQPVEFSMSPPPENGKVTIQKTSGNTDITMYNSNYTLEGAVFTVYSDSACTKSVGKLTTKANGLSNELTVTAGTYYVKETTAPKGFLKDSSTKSVKVAAGGTGKVQFSDKPKTGTIAIKKTSKDSATKDNPSYSLLGAEYTVYSDNACTASVGKITTDEKGEGKLSNLPLGTYYVKETKAPKGHDLDPKTYPAACLETNAAATEYTVQSSDDAKYGEIVLTKTSRNNKLTDGNKNYSLEGAEYGVYKDNACTQLVGTITTDAKGVGKLTGLLLGTYYVKETKAPAGFVKDTEVHLVECLETVDNGHAELDVDDVPNNVTISLIKKSDNPDVSETNGCYSLKDAEYTVYSDSGCSKIVGTIVTDADGKGSLKGLPLGQYWVKETKEPKGFALDATVYPVDVTKGDASIENIEKSVTSTDVARLDPTPLLLQKIDKDTGKPVASGNATLEGAQFLVKFYGDVIQDKDPAKSGATPLRQWIMRTDKEGLLKLQNSYKVSGDEFWKYGNGYGLPFGTLTFQEIEAPDGYKRNPEVFVAKIDGNSSATIVYQEPTVPEDSIDLELAKVQSGTTTAIPGAVFEHTNPDGTTERLTTDEYGALVFKGLRRGKHTVAEISCPDGYTVNKNVLAFTVADDAKITVTSKSDDTLGRVTGSVNGEGNLIVTYEDNTAPFKLHIHKINDKNAALEGAEFTLYSDKACTKAVSTARTDANGDLTITGLKTDTDYFLKETKAPDGYRPLVDFFGKPVVWTIRVHIAG